MFKTLQVIAFLGMQAHCFGASTVPDFSAVYDNRKKTVKIKWQNRSHGVNTFIIQRASANRAWTDIALQATGPDTENKPFNFEDKKPEPGENYYRLKCIYNNNQVEYSLVVMVIIGAKGFDWVMFPVPVTDLLTLQYKGTEAINGVINVLIQGSNGRIFNRLRFSSLTTVIKIPVSNLGRGIYDVRIAVGDEMVWNQRFLK